MQPMEGVVFLQTIHTLVKIQASFKNHKELKLICLDKLYPHFFLFVFVLKKYAKLKCLLTNLGLLCLFVRHVLFLYVPLLPCCKLFNCSSSGGPVIPRMYAVDVSRSVRDLSLSQGKPSSTSEGENPLQSLRGCISTTPSISVHASYWPFAIVKMFSISNPAPSSPHAYFAQELSVLSHAKEIKAIQRGRDYCLAEVWMFLFNKLKTDWLCIAYQANFFFIVLMIKKIVGVALHIFCVSFALIWRQISLPALVHSHYYSLPSL